MNFISEKKTVLSEAIVALLEILVPLDDEEESDVVKFQQNFMGFVADVWARLEGKFVSIILVRLYICYFTSFLRRTGSFF
jgi:hypothetical protein